MTDFYPPASTPDSGSGDSGASGAVNTAKEQAVNVGQTAAENAKDVAGTAKDEASKVASEAKKQAKDLFAESRTQLTEQAGAQQAKVASGLRSLSDELSGMADNSEQQGVAADLVSQVASRAGSVAGWLDSRDPGSLLDEVKGFARQRPGTFIALAAAAGLVAGRLTRNLASEAKDAKEAEADSGSVAPAASAAPAASQVVPPVATGVPSYPAAPAADTYPAPTHTFTEPIEPASTETWRP